MDQDQKSRFESKLAEIYYNSNWLKYEISLEGFLDLFPVSYLKGKPLKIESPQGFSLDRSTYLAIRVAFRQAYS